MTDALKFAGLNVSMNNQTSGRSPSFANVQKATALSGFEICKLCIAIGIETRGCDKHDEEPSNGSTR
jgi:hypothetical protein